MKNGVHTVEKCGKIRNKSKVHRVFIIFKNPEMFFPLVWC